jgi:hypothetical protein
MFCLLRIMRKWREEWRGKKRDGKGREKGEEGS